MKNEVQSLVVVRYVQCLLVSTGRLKNVYLNYTRLTRLGHIDFIFILDCIPLYLHVPGTLSYKYFKIPLNIATTCTTKY